MSTLERALFTSVRWLAVTLVAALPLLVVDIGDDLLVGATAHLSVIVLATYALAIRVAGLVDQPMFVSVVAERRRMFAAAAAITAVVTGYAALATLASSAALRFDASMQFLQLLSALDIAWVVAASTIGIGWLAGRRAGRIGGAVIAVICVWSIWRYLEEVGFGPNGEWIVSGEALGRLVLPYDMVAAVIAVTTVLLGARRQATAQPTPQS